MKEIKDFKDIRLELQQPTIGAEVLGNIRKQSEVVAKYAKEAYQEGLRRHVELNDSIREAGKQGASIIVGDNASDVQIQQNSAGARQILGKPQVLDYEQVAAILDEIIGYFIYPQFDKTFGENTEAFKSHVIETKDAVSKGEEETLVKKSLKTIRDLAIGATGSLIASGIIALLGQLPLG